ncbi:MAG: Spy/CpxP family protein refolding chaperone [Acidobacteriaceae bacterium]|nr:Spy/CpxP family protein refolding chaperone [Acidobacteriaceae bacterium]
MKTKVSVSLAIAAASALGLMAQSAGSPPGPPPPAQVAAHRLTHLTTLLSLTSAQQNSATSIFSAEETTLETIHTSMTTARQALHTAVQANDANGISSAAAQIGSLTTQEVQARATADAAFYALLTAEQKSKFDELRPPHPGGGPAPGPLGPPGPPPAPPDQN